MCWSNLESGSQYDPVADKCHRINCDKKMSGRYVVLQTAENDIGIREMIVLTSECLAVNNKPCIFPATVNGVYRAACWLEGQDQKESCATEVSDNNNMDSLETSECQPSCPGVMKGIPHTK